MNICFVAPEIYPALNPAAGIEHIGGLEMQLALLGRGLAARGHRIAYVTRDHGQPDGERLGPFTVFRTCREEAGFPGTRFFYPRFPSLLAALSRADADIYCVRGAGYSIAAAVALARWRGRRTVFAVAAAADLDATLRRLPTLRDEHLYRLGLRRADAIVVQSDDQRMQLRKWLGREGALIRSAAEAPSGPVADGHRDSVLWVGMFREVKRPLAFVELARCYPGIRFVMVGGPVKGHEAVYTEVVTAAARVPNLKLAGFQPHSHVDRYFGRARLLVNTSRHEGFPNTFLQAWAHGVPVLSTVDPDGLLVRHGLGCHVLDTADLARALPGVLSRLPAPAAGIRAYFLENHALEQAAARYESLFQDVLNRRQARNTGALLPGRGAP